jgi:hypothetical protein
MERRIEHMKKASRLLVGLGIVLAFATGASADIAWTFNDVNFDLVSWNSNYTGFIYTPVASLSGSFSTDNAVTTVTDFSDLTITAQPGYSSFAFPVAGVVDSYLPGEIGIYSAGFSSYIDLYLTSPLNGAGGSYSFSAGYDCPGCAVLLPNSDTGVAGDAPIVRGGTLSSTPEPGLYAVLAIGLAGLGFAYRRKRLIANSSPKHS